MNATFAHFVVHLFCFQQVSKAMNDKRACASSGDEKGVAYHARRIELFTEQLVEANPILSEISACMTGEGRALVPGNGEKDLAQAADFTARKTAANAALQACSQKYNAAMKAHRESYVAAAP